MKLDKEGKVYKNFKVTKFTPIEEIKCNIIELVHGPTNAKVMHILNDDQENLFSLSFQTFPSSSNGVAHVLEHTVLCGSDKFPVKDPFFSMRRRSLNTFMNAMTGSDFTCYPASSQVEKDFYNLLEVYLDAVFYPKLDYLSFLQEGHRLEFQDPNNPKTPLLIKGIVYNEMKGSMNSYESRLWHEMSRLLFPDLPYSFNSGGDPKEIPYLTHEELVEFHKNFYHPSRCLFFFYGNLLTTKHLDFIEKTVLKDIEAISSIDPLPLQKRFTSPVYAKTKYPVAKQESLENKAIISFGFLTSHISDQEEILALTLLTNILLSNDASLLKLEILKSKLCAEAVTFFDTEITEAPLIIICKGCNENDAEKLEKVIFSSLQNIVKDTIKKHLIDAALHQLEISRLEIDGEGYPYGLLLFFRSALLKQHGCDAENALAIHSLFEKLEEKLKDPTYLTDLIDKHLLNNPHYVQLTMTADPNLEDKELKEEKELLSDIEKGLTKQLCDKIILESKKMKKHQEKLEEKSIECLPMLSEKDIPKTTKDYPLNIEKIINFNIYHHDCFTNDILYTDIVFNLPNLSSEELIYLSLFSHFLTEVGSGNRDYKENLEFIQANTGGISAFLSTNPLVKDANHCLPSITISGKSLYKNADKLFQLLHDTLTSLNFNDPQRIKELLTQQYVILSTGLNQNAMKYAINNAQRNLCLSSHLSSLWSGLSYFRLLNDLMKNIDQSVEKIIKIFDILKNKVLLLENADLVLSCSKSHYEHLKEKNFFDLSKVTLQPYKPFSCIIECEDNANHAYAIASPVAFTASAYQTNLHYQDPLSAAMLVSTHLMENKVLHSSIREKGGAYGSGARFSTTTGNFYFYAFRDPHIASSINTFSLAIKDIANLDFSSQDLLEAKLQSLQSFDQPIIPGLRALTAYNWQRSGKTKKLRKDFRSNILSLTKHDIQAALSKYLLSQTEPSITTFASEELIEKENPNLKEHPLIISKIVN